MVDDILVVEGVKDGDGVVRIEFPKAPDGPVRIPVEKQ
jgi:hypothetical protein